MRCINKEIDWISNIHTRYIYIYLEKKFNREQVFTSVKDLIGASDLVPSLEQNT